MIQVSRGFDGIWIPREIWLDPELSIQEKCLWAEIRSLGRDQPIGCFASNEYLASFIGTKERQLQTMLSGLKAKGLVEQVAFDGRQRYLKAYMPKEEKTSQDKENQEDKSLSDESVRGRGAENCTPQMQKTAPLPLYKRVKLREKRKEKKKGDETPPLEPPVSFFTYNKVKMKQEDYDKLIAKHGEPTIKDYLEQLHLYSETHPKKFKAYGSHAAVIEAWIRKNGDKPAKTAPAWKESKDAMNRNRELGAAAEKAYGSGSYQYIQANNDGVFFANHNRQFTKTLSYEMPTQVFIQEANRCLQALNAPLYFEENGTLRSR